ncbi:major head protein [Gordonia phage Petra]|uniref:Major capsid protein n=4 Tax=root TaxID=1 RepID=A0A2U8UK99_9CAUD|nr:hypothetical protein [Gordonia westfalica]YP_009291961.1 major head protein [Gordonia phage CarolAnn]YP_010095400.1 major head protein [Gordonia phage Petra]YP_010101656.1 major head protein [Gordonia phage Walrus]YP_010114095.1 major head protein [Gordonia phage Blino]AOE44027.1 major capsid protein [Gordonia phage CarolAnn]AWN04119.1 major capsid protein [Gordonia phage Petra]QBG78397.1 major capsid protein [Gordonia phage Walrus]QPL13954.1 major capsid protein [Gordonia phage Blino]S
MATNTPVVSIDDGNNITVDQVMGNPRAIPQRVIDLVRDNIMGEAFFRNAGNPGSLLVQFQRSTPLFLDGDPEAVAEFGEIPVFDLGEGLPEVARGVKVGAAVRVSREMRDFNQIDKVRKQVTGTANTVIRANDSAFREAIEDASVPEHAATAAWDAVSPKIRTDIKEAAKTVASALHDGDPTKPKGYVPDTLVLNSSLLYDFMDDDEFNKIYVGNVADQSIRYTGKLPNKVLNLNVLHSPLWPLDRALVAQRNVIGFYADPRSLESTGLYPEGGGPNGGPTESWRSDTTQIRMIGVDEPEAACWITGIQ